MSLHVIVGAGPVGSATASRLAAAGERVRVITRHGTGPDTDGVEKVAADATDAGGSAAWPWVPPSCTTALVRHITGGRRTGRRSRPPCSPPPSAPALCW